MATCQLTLGSRRFPERPIDSVGEQYLRLREAAGVMYGESEISITPTDFINKKAAISWDMKRVGHQGASHSGLSTKNGDLMTIDIKNYGLGSAGDFCLVYIVYELLFSLRDGSVDVFD